MDNGLFAYILKHSKRQQIILMLLTVLSFPFYYLSLDLPKTIINDAISGTDFPVNLSFELPGFSANVGYIEQVPYLLLLCFVFLFLVLINSGFKLFINIYRGMLGERMLRRMRLQLIERIMKFPLARFRNTSQGELVSMVNQETEPLGGFIGDSISLPLYQGGLLLTIVVFMFVQDWKMGLAAIALYPVQAWLIPKLQRQVNLLNRQRTLRIRNLAENLGEVVAGINEIHINDNSGFFRDYFSKLLGGIFNIRVQIYKKKFFIKFLNNSIAQLTPFFFFLIGGLLVIRGDLSIGALVAVLAAYKDLSPPWKELLSWYQGQADSRMRFSVLVDQFHVDNESPPSQESLTQQWLEELPDLSMTASNATLLRHDGIREVDNVSLTVSGGDWISLVGKGASGKSALAQMFAGLVSPTTGKILMADQDISHIPKMTKGRGVSYVGHDSYLFATSIRDNLLISLKFRPQENLLTDTLHDESIQFKNWREEARLSGNSDVDLSANWIDHQSAGAADENELVARMGTALRVVNAEDDLVRYALACTISPDDYPELTERIIQARALFKERIVSQGLESIVEFLDPNQYNDNASLAENILFGASNHDMFSVDGLTEHPLLKTLLKENKLAKTLDDAAIRTAKTMVELFSDLPPGHEFFERYSFVDADDLPELKRILVLIDKTSSIESLAVAERKLIRSLLFRIISGRHRLGLFQGNEKDLILQLRHSFASQLDVEASNLIDFFSPDRFNALTPIAENIIFGRIVFGRMGAEDQVYRIILEVLQSLDLMSPILEIGLSAPTGLAGALLPVSQRQKLLLARGLLKRPKVLVVNEGLSALDSHEIDLILSGIKQEYPRLSLFWVDSQARFPTHFDQVAYLQAGKLVKIEASVPQNTDSEKTQDTTAGRSVRSASSVNEDEKITLLRKIPLFRFLDDPQLMLLAMNCDALNIAQGERLVNQNEPGDALYIIVDGKATVLIANGVSEEEVGQCSINDVIGELALLSDEPRFASVQATTNMAVLRLRREVFIDMLQSNGEIGYQILQVVVNRFSETNRNLANITRS